MAEQSIQTSAHINNRMARFAAWNKLSLDMIRRSVMSALMIGVGLFILFALLSYSPNDPGWTHVSSDGKYVTNLMGASGAWLADVLFAFLGYAAWLLPLFFLYELVNLWWVKRNAPRSLRYPAVVFAILALAASLALLLSETLTGQSLSQVGSGGLSGGILGYEIGQSVAFIAGSGIAGKSLALLFTIPLFLLAFSYGFQVQWRTLWRSRHNLFAPRVIETANVSEPIYNTDRTLMPRRDEPSLAESIKNTLKPTTLKPKTLDSTTLGSKTWNATAQSANTSTTETLSSVDRQIPQRTLTASLHTATNQSVDKAVISDSFQAGPDTAVPMPTQPIPSRPLVSAEGVSLGNDQEQSDSRQPIERHSVISSQRIDPTFDDLDQLLDMMSPTPMAPSRSSELSQPVKPPSVPNVMDTLNKLSKDETGQPVVFGGLDKQGIAEKKTGSSAPSMASRIAEKARQARAGLTPNKMSDKASFSGLNLEKNKLGNPSNPNASLTLGKHKQHQRDDDQIDLLNDVPSLIPQPTYTASSMSEETGQTNASNVNQVSDNDGISSLEAELEALIAEEQTVQYTENASSQMTTLPDVLTDTFSENKTSRAFMKAAHRANLSPLPSLELLEKPDPNQKPSYSPQELNRLSELLEIKLNEFNIKATVASAQPGPVVTRFEVDLAPGVKASKVTNISRDLARSLSMASVRVVEVIPGKPYIGIEVPNQKREMVRLYELLQTKDYQDPKAGLSMALGKDIAGRPVVTDLAKAPHMLVAGTTGSGKSVAVNAMLLSLLLKYTPEQLRLILIDPKQLELANYNDIPHLLTEVVTDMKDAASALNWCVMEMERRYKLMAFLKVRKLADYNKKIEAAEKRGEDFLDPLWRPNDNVSTDKPPRLKPIPLVVVVADEFADMIMQVGKQAEELITRLAQKSRAAGIHLILATQRPSVDVITGLIKANIPTRVALRVNSKVDSRTILDSGGAEDMLGNGDMLFLGPGKIEPERAHGAYISDDEVNTICDAWRERGSPDYIEDMLSNFDLDGGGSSDSGGSSIKTGDQDALYDEAVAFVMETRKVSASSIQRKFSIGYNRAARIVDAMESAGLVTSMGKSGKREILM